MNKLQIKISVYIYGFMKLLLGIITPFATLFIAYKTVNRHNLITVFCLILIWIVITIIVGIIANYLYDEIRYRFKKFDDFLYEIENYIENKKYK